jgi:hypothetical protein
MTQSGRPLDARAETTMPVVELLGAATAQAYAAQLAAFRQGLKEAGFVEGRDVAIEYRWADDQYDRLPGLAADLVSRNVAVITTIGGSAEALAAKTSVDRRPINSTMGNYLFRARQFRSAALPMPDMENCQPYWRPLTPKWRCTNQCLLRGQKRTSALQEIVS